MARIIANSVNLASAGTAVQFKNVPARVLSIIFKARGGNSGNIYIGDSTAAAAVGLELSPGEAVTLPISDSVQETGKPHTIPLSDFYFDGSVTNDDCDFIALVE